MGVGNDLFLTPCSLGVKHGEVVTGAARGVVTGDNFALLHSREPSVKKRWRSQLVNAPLALVRIVVGGQVGRPFIDAGPRPGSSRPVQRRVQPVDEVLRGQRVEALVVVQQVVVVE